MVSYEDDKLRIQAWHEIVAFVREFAKKYQRLFKDGYYKDLIPYQRSLVVNNPFDITLEIKRRE